MAAFVLSTSALANVGVQWIMQRVVKILLSIEKEEGKG